MSHESQSIEVRVTHNDPDAPWPVRKTRLEASVVHTVERGPETLSYRRDLRRAPCGERRGSSSASGRSHRRSKSR